MKHSTLLLPIVALAVAACSKTETEPTQPTNTNNSILPFAVAQRPYNTARGGVQITGVYYDQDSNKTLTGTLDEWIVIETDKTSLNARMDTECR